MMLALLDYSYASGVFAAGASEQVPFENLAVRPLCAETHPDYDMICAFRREHRALLAGGSKSATSMSRSTARRP